MKSYNIPFHNSKHKDQLQFCSRLKLFRAKILILLRTKFSCRWTVYTNNINFMSSSYECLHNAVVFLTYLYSTVTLRGLLKATNSFVTPVHLSVSQPALFRPPHVWTISVPKGRNFIFGGFTKTWREHLSLLKFGKEPRKFVSTTTYIYI